MEKFTPFLVGVLFGIVAVILAVTGGWKAELNNDFGWTNSLELLAPLVFLAMVVERAVEIWVIAWRGEREDKAKLKLRKAGDGLELANQAIANVLVALQTARSEADSAVAAFKMAEVVAGDPAAPLQTKADVVAARSMQESAIEKLKRIEQYSIDSEKAQAFADKEYKDAETELATFSNDTRAYTTGLALLFGILCAAAGCRVLQHILILGAVESQQRLYIAVDILLTGALLAGGSEPIHKIITTFTTFLDVTKSRVEAQGGK